MSKVGISIKLDVTKIDKARLFQGEKGTYLDLTTFVDLDSKDQYDNNGFIAQSQTKEERESGAEKPPILGNVRVFYKDTGAGAGTPGAAQPSPAAPNTGGGDFDDSIPFSNYEYRTVF